MKESVEQFGSDCNMVGVFTNAGDADGQTKSTRPVVMILNAGLVHRVGPFRMNVDIARAAAEGGFNSFRFDMTGLGDSDARGDTMKLRERVVRDIQDAMDHISTRYGATSFILFGLCSGAVNAHYAAAEDPRVVGCMLLDAYAYPTPKYYLRRYGPKLKKPKRVAKGIIRRVKHGVRRALDWEEGADATGNLAKPEGEGLVYLQETPNRDGIARELSEMLSRGTKFLFLYCGIWYVNYLEQLADSMPEVDFTKGATITHWPDADHTCTVLSDKRRLLSAISTWLDKEFGAT